MNTLATVGRPLAIAALLLTGACAQMSGQTREQPGGGPPQTEAQAAQSALAALPDLVNATNFSAVGFAAPEDARRARAGEPLPQRVVAYDRLLAWQPGIAVDDLLDPQELLLYPVEVDGSARTSFVLRKVADGWRVAAVGDRSPASALRRAKEYRSGQAQVRFLDVPGLNLAFLQVTRGDEVLLVPTRDAPELDWKEGASRRLVEGLAMLAGHARKFEELHGKELREHRLVR